MSITAAPALRARAEALGAGLPALLAAADHLAGAVMFGAHGRRQAGEGDAFWQFRPAHAGDPARAIDWRRSARGDTPFVREREWQVAQGVTIWVDPSASMQFAGAKGAASKADRARVLALALAILLLRGGERVGLMAPHLPPRAGRAQTEALALGLLSSPPAQDYGTPPVTGFAPHGRAVLISDFFGDPRAVADALAAASAAGVRGVMLQILDPAEEDFPFDGRTIFESMSGSLSHETLRAGDLRARYHERLAQRRDQLGQMAGAAGWLVHHHAGGGSLAPALLWLHRALAEGLGC